MSEENHEQRLWAAVILTALQDASYALAGIMETSPLERQALIFDKLYASKDRCLENLNTDKVCPLYMWPSQERRKAREEAIRWFESKSRDFFEVCEAAGYEPEVVYEQYLIVREETDPLIEELEVAREEAINELADYRRSQIRSVS